MSIKKTTEHEEQKAVCQWLRAKGIKHFAVPNANAMSGKNRNMAVCVMAKLHAEGVSPGVPDLFIFLTGKLLAIEMKVAKTMGKCGKLIGGGRVSKHQAGWIQTINKYPYADCYVCYGADSAIACVEAEIKLDDEGN